MEYNSLHSRLAFLSPVLFLPHSFYTASLFKFSAPIVRFVQAPARDPYFTVTPLILSGASSVSFFKSVSLRRAFTARPLLPSPIELCRFPCPAQPVMSRRSSPTSASRTGQTRGTWETGKTSLDGATLAACMSLHLLPSSPLFGREDIEPNTNRAAGVWACLRIC